MKIKNILYSASIAMLLTGCSNIAEDERLIYVEPATVNRNVLIEDFTGQRCINCPNATEAIHEIQNLYGEDHAIAVAIHCGPFGVEGTKGLVTEAGKEYWNRWFDASQGQPVAKINRGQKNDEYANWANAVAQELKKTTTVKLDVKVSYDESTRKLTISSLVSDEKKTPGNLQLWLIEDSIVGAQYMPDGKAKTDYIHNHIFRDAINGTWGEEIKYDTSSPIEHTYTLPEKYNPANCSIVAFVYNENGVEQAVRTHP